MIKINWLDSQSHLLLNPKLPLDQGVQLTELCRKITEQENMNSGLIWIASSGSAKQKNESVKLIALSKKHF